MAGRKRTAKKDRDSIRVKIGYGGGPWTIEQFRDMMIEALHQTAATGITHIARANLYYNPVDAKGNTVNRIGRALLPDFDVPAPYRSAAEEHGV